MPRTLVVGGTGFLGAAIAAQAVASGHAVSVLTRGRTEPIAGATQITADRFGSLSAVQGQDFDLVFDTCAYVPGAVAHLLNVVHPRRYVLMSSVSVHDRFDQPDLSESSAVPEATEADLIPFRAQPFANWAQIPIKPESYGPLKRSCELAALAALGDRVIILRAGLLVGAGDRSRRVIPLATGLTAHQEATLLSDLP